MKLLVVESPSIVKTLQSFLQRWQPGQWHVVATGGHVRSLPPMKGRRFEDVFDVHNDFAESWIIDESKNQAVEKLGEAIEASSKLYLATSPSREGEANAWHILEHFGLDNPHRVLLHSLCCPDVITEIKEARYVSQLLVDAQRARVAIDYLVGMEVSRRLWAIGAKGIGRLQGCVLRLIVDRERQTQEPKQAAAHAVRCTYRVRDSEWSLLGGHAIEQCGVDGWSDIRATADDAPGMSQPDASGLAELARKHRHSVASVRRRLIREKPPLPLTTASLLSLAAAKYGMSTTTTVAAAQALFEAGLITCPRSDAPYLSKETVDGMRAYIGGLWPNAFPEHDASSGRRRKSDEDGEAIRPSVLRRSPMAELPLEQELLYDLIFERTLMSQGRISEHSVVTVTIDIEGTRQQLVGRYVEPFVSGWKEIDSDFKPAPDIKFPAESGEAIELQQVAVEEIEPRQAERFTEASLIEHMAANKLGRASTYLGIVGALEHRGYIVEREGVLAPTPLGMRVDEVLRSDFDELFREDFTANTETCLESIAAGRLRRPRFLAKFYERFLEMLEGDGTDHAQPATAER